MPAVLMRALCGLLSGWLLALSFPLSLPPLHLPQPIGLVPPVLPGAGPDAAYTQIPWLAFIALIPLLEAVRLSPNGRQAFFWGYFAGVVWLSGHFIWLSSFGVAPVALLTLFFALPVGLFGWLAHLVYRRGGPGLAVWGLAGLWTAIEFLRSFGMWAYPWNLLGYSQARELPFIQSADLGGVYLVTFLIALSSTALLALLANTGAFRLRLGHACIAGALILANLSYGEYRLATEHDDPAALPYQVALIQGGVESFRSWNVNFLNDVMHAYVPPSRDAINRWEEETLQAEQEDEGLIGPPTPRDMLVVWPETTIPRSVDPRHPERLPSEVLSLVSHTPSTDLLIGVAGYPHDDAHAENGSIFVTDHGLEWAYSKLRLVPYGEVVPFRAVVRFLEYPWGDEDITGSRSLEPVQWRGREIGPLICFDNVFPYVTREYAQEGAGSFILMTNNSWYKLQSGIRQHCDMDILRAVECRKPLSRVSTTGWSHIIDPAGRTVRTSDINKHGVVYGKVTPRHGETPYVRWGDAFALICLLGSLALAAGVIIPGESEGIL